MPTHKPRSQSHETKHLYPKPGKRVSGRKSEVAGGRSGKSLAVFADPVFSFITELVFASMSELVAVHVSPANNPAQPKCVAFIIQLTLVPCYAWPLI